MPQPAVQSLTDVDLERRLYHRPALIEPTRPPPVPACAWIYAERRKPGVTLELLRLEYLEQYPAGDRYTRSCEHYRRRLSRACSDRNSSRAAWPTKS